MTLKLPFVYILLVKKWEKEMKERKGKGRKTRRKEERKKRRKQGRKEERTRKGKEKSLNSIRIQRIHKRKK